ncbi:hypothetical protein FRC11_003587, partial [Ceratobasidium sp. 423]
PPPFSPTTPIPHDQRRSPSPISLAPPADVPAGPIEAQPLAIVPDPHHVPGHLPQNIAAENGPVIEAVEHIIIPAQDGLPLEN